MGSTLATYVRAPLVAHCKNQMQCKQTFAGLSLEILFASGGKAKERAAAVAVAAEGEGSSTLADKLSISK